MERSCDITVPRQLRHAVLARLHEHAIIGPEVDTTR
jgi:hypothetical protein